MAEVKNKLGISKKYLRFFVENNRERYVICCGGRRSSKTYSTLRWIWFLGSGKPITIMIAAASNSQLLATIQDFRDCLGINVEGSILYGYHARLTNGTIFQFKSFDLYTKCVGQKADILFLNEAINLDEQSFTTLVQGITTQIFLNYNPTSRNTWINKFVAKDKHNFLRTTFKDNEYLRPEQVSEFEGIRERAMSPTATPFDLYAYRVFYLGEDADMGGKCFPLVYSCTDEEYDRLPAKEAYSIDFGIVESRDQTAMAGIKICNNCLYCKEYIYDNGAMQNDKQLAMRLHQLGINEFVDLCCDGGGMGKQRIHNLITAGDGTWTEEGINKGFNCYSVKKTKIIDSIQQMCNYDKIIVTESSYNLRNELAEYELDDSGKPKGNLHDHLVSCVRYAVISYSNLFFY